MHAARFVLLQPSEIDAAVGPYVTVYAFQEEEVLVPSENSASKFPSPSPGLLVEVYS